ncbi:MAG: ATP-binding protein [Candidatus Methanofastidiosia archaeon]
MVLKKADGKKLQHVIESLNKAGFSIRQSATQEEIFTIAARELEKFDFCVIFMVFDKDLSSGKITYLTKSKRIMKPVRETLMECTLPVNSRLRKTIIKKKEPFFVENVRELLHILIPPHIISMLEELAGNLNISGKNMIAVPLLVNNESAGILAAVSHRISEEDIPLIQLVGNQVSTCLENMRLRAESEQRTQELARKLEELQTLGELNTSVFLAASQDDVLDATIEGIYRLGGFFSAVSLLNEKRTRATIVRVKMNSSLLKTVEKMAGSVVPEWTIKGHQVPVTDKNNIYHTFFDGILPLISSNIIISGYKVRKADLFEIYAGAAPPGKKYHKVVKNIAEILPYRSIMVFPLVVERRTVGMLAVASEGGFSEEDFVLIRTVAEMVSGAMERVFQAEKLTKTMQELRAVQRINTLLSTGAPLKEILNQISLSIKEIFHYDFARTFLLDSSKKYLSLSSLSASPEIRKKVQTMLGITFEDFRYPITENQSLYRVIHEKVCLIFKGLGEIIQEIPVPELQTTAQAFADELSRGMEITDETYIMVAPLPYGDDVIGVLFLGHKNPLTEEDFNRLEYFLDQVGIAITKSDIESRLRYSLEEIKELDEMKSEFIDIASHELRTPLTTLKLYLQMMSLEKYGRLSESLKKRMQVMEEGVNRLEDIINQTLVASRLLKNKLALEKKPVSLLEIASEVVDQLRPLWEIKSQNVFIESPRNLSLIEGDRKALFTMMSNLVDNAVRYSPQNSEILIKLVEHSVEIECMVIDQGSGIPPEHSEKIFEEFYIVPSSTEYARMDGRTGLGLFIARGIIQRHKGRIWVESALEEGSTFHVAIPKL